MGGPGTRVTGRGSVSGAPDTVSVTMGVSVRRPTAPEAIAAAAASASRLTEALKQSGVAGNDLRTANYSINQEFAYPTDAAPRPDGFRVSNDVVAKVRNVDNVGAVIDAATAAAGDDVVVQNVSFGMAADTGALESARDAAFADAMAKAEQFARLSGRGLGRVVSVVETVLPPSGAPMLARMAFDGAATTPIQAGEVETSVTVEVSWDFADE